MANDEQLKKTKKSARAKPGIQKKSIAKPPENTGKSQAKTSEPEEKDKNAAEEFRKSAAHEVASGADEIVKGLKKKAAEGSIGCARFLWEVVNSAKTEANSPESNLAVQLIQLSAKLEKDSEMDRTASRDSSETRNNH